MLQNSGRAKELDLSIPQLMQNMFDNKKEAVLVTDIQGNLILANTVMASGLGLSLDYVLKSNVQEIVRSGYYDKSYILEAAYAKSPVTGLISTKLKEFWKTRSAPVIDETGQVKVIVTVGNKVPNPEKSSRSQVKGLCSVGSGNTSQILKSDTIVAESMAMKNVLLTANAVAQTDSTSVLYGESGSGKEVVARYIHENSKRSEGPLIAVNCGAFPENLIESELFGYEKGAFTGAKNEGRAGLFEAAHGGTLFLDEIAELPLSLQPRLLRVLETRTVRRLGSNQERPIDVRVIAATHKDLKKMVEEGTFRRDLYYRLDVISIQIPPLRERPQDAVALAAKFLHEFSTMYGVGIPLDHNIISLCKTSQWPGNVRELRNEMERRVVLGFQQAINHGILVNTESDIKKITKQSPALMATDGLLKEAVNKFEIEYIHMVLAECNGRIGQAAERLGICRTALYRKLKSNEL